jgi:hypothetical protein
MDCYRIRKESEWLFSIPFVRPRSSPAPPFGLRGKTNCIFRVDIKNSIR